MENKYYYNDHTRISKSGLDLINRSPAHYKWSIENPKEDTEALIFGKLVHCLILEPETFDEKFIISPKIDRRTKEGKEAYQLLCDNQNGRIVISEEQEEQASIMASKVLNHSLGSRLLSNGKPEVKIYWECPITGCKFRSMIDYLNDYVIDLKTTEDARPESFQRSITKYRYDVQGAVYLDAVEISTGIRPKGFIVIAIEKTEPYNVAIYLLDEIAIESGKSKYIRNAFTYKECFEANYWPGYDEQINLISLPSYAL